MGGEIEKRPAHIRLMENYKRSWRPDRQIQPLNARQHFVSLSLQSDYREPSKVRLINRISHIHRILQPLKLFFFKKKKNSLFFFFFFWCGQMAIVLHQSMAETNRISRAEWLEEWNSAARGRRGKFEWLGSFFFPFSFIMKIQQEIRNVKK